MKAEHDPALPGKAPWIARRERGGLDAEASGAASHAPGSRSSGVHDVLREELPDQLIAIGDGKEPTHKVTSDRVDESERHRGILRSSLFRARLRLLDRYGVEFQTPAIVQETVADESVDIHLTVEEAEALARAAKSAELKDRRQRALLDQALDQIALVCRQVRDRVLAADEFIES